MGAKKTCTGNPLLGNLAEMARDAANKTKNVSLQKENKETIEKINTEGWQAFCEYAQKYSQKGKGCECCIWIDEEVKKALEKMRAAAGNAPIKYLADAAIRTFIEEHRGDITLAISTCGEGDII